MPLDTFHYTYPPELIAHDPLPERDAARLLVLDRATGALAHRHVHDLPALLQPGDVLVINTSKVIPARLVGTRATGGKVEVLLLSAVTDDRRVPAGRVEGPTTDDGSTWWCLATRTNRLAVGTRIAFAHGLEGIVDQRTDDRLAIRFNIGADLLPLLDRIGLPPLPPYIRRMAHGAQRTTNDRERYQTIYADTPGSAAAPTAGLHLTHALLDRLRAGGIIIVPLTLHVGTDTFAPVRTTDIATHRMQGERYAIPAATVAAVASARRDGHRVIAVGTTSVRALESAADLFAKSEIHASTYLFITPGYRFRVVDALLTNFHQPRSTLLMLVAALAGTDTIRRAYTEAIAQRYRLFSYGDAMFIG